MRTRSEACRGNRSSDTRGRSAGTGSAWLPNLGKELQIRALEGMELRLRRFAHHKRLLKLEQVLGNPGGESLWGPRLRPLPGPQGGV